MTANISVIMPTYNRADMLRETLEGLCKLDLKGIDAEFIVIDNNSTDSTANVVADFSECLPLKYLFEEKNGKNHAITKGLECVEGSLLVFTDDDITPVKDWLQVYVSGAERWPEHVLFAGPVATTPPPGVDPDLAKIADTIGVGDLRPSPSAGQVHRLYGPRFFPSNVGQDRDGKPADLDAGRSGLRQRHVRRARPAHR